MLSCAIPCPKKRHLHEHGSHNSVLCTSQCGALHMHAVKFGVWVVAMNILLCEVVFVFVTLQYR